jgi:uroporphyrinogen decarboxylase
MTSRENFARILRRDRPDHVMIDFGGCPLSRIDPACQASLLDYLGYPHGEPDRTPGSKNVDERLLQHFGIEVRSVGGMMKPVHSLYRKISDTEFIDHWGIRKRFTGMYWDIVQSPLQGASLEDLEKYPWPDGDDLDAGLLERYAREAKDLRENTDFVLCAEHPVYGIFEMGCWMCGFSDFLTKMALEPEFVQRFFEIFLGYQKKVIRAYYGALGPYLDYTSSGDDFATQNGPFFSSDMFDELVAPYFSERISYTKRFTSAAFLHHSCGSVISLIPSLIRCGVEILNPLQPRARDMDPAVLKRKFGGKITFHGGFDTQQTLLEKDPAKIEQEVARLMDTLGRDGGYVFAAAHNLQADVPPQNIVTMLEAAKKYGKIS